MSDDDKGGADAGSAPLTDGTSRHQSLARHASTPVPTSAVTELVVDGSTASEQSVSSPSGDATITFELVDGRPFYSVSYRGRTPVAPSTLGFEFAHQPDLLEGFEVTGAERTTSDTIWEPVWGEHASIRDHYNELTVGLEHASGQHLNLTFRAYDDGVAFRYVIPSDAGMDGFTVTAERTGFDFAGDFSTWWIPNNWNNYEYVYQNTPLSEAGYDYGNHDKTSDVDGMNTPLTMRVDDDCYMAIHEAALTDWAEMTLTRYHDQPTRFESDLVPYPDYVRRVVGVAPHASPWRTFTFGERPGDLLESTLTLNLNEPCAYEDTDWIEPQKYCGVWWEIHIGKTTWEPGPNVGATTENVKEYIDFAAEHGIENVFAEGWNSGWGDGDNKPDDGPFGWEDMLFTETHDRFDFEGVTEYATEQGVSFMAHNETGSNVAGLDRFSYESQLEDAFQLYAEAGIRAVKTGYVNEDGVYMDDSGVRYHHHSQPVINHYDHVVRTAAKYHLMINNHEPVKPTGKRRTYPNFMTREGVSGMEYQNFRGGGNPPSHTPSLAFTRMLAGPVDYNTGIFNLTYREYTGTRVNNTRARELAQLVIFHSGLQMVTDRPENYDFDREAFEFVKAVPVDWDETRVLTGDIGQHVTIARRSGEDWWLGTAVADPEWVPIELDFLSGTYDAHVYQDGYKATTYGYESAVDVQHFEIEGGDTLWAPLPHGGGQAVHLTPATGDLRPIPGHYETFSSAPEHDVAYDAAEFTIETAGEGLWGGTDDYTVVYEPDAVGPDGRVEAAVTSQAGTDPAARSGVVLRNDVTGTGESLGYVALVVTPDLGVHLQWDGNDDGHIDRAVGAFGSTPVRLRLERDGATFEGLYSTDGGTTWDSVGTCTVESAAERQDAALVHSASTAEGGRATFDDFRVDDRIPMTRPLPDGLTAFDTSGAEFGLDQNGETLHINAAGRDVWTDDDEYGAIVDPDSLADGGSVVARVTGQEDSHDWAKAGIMVRNDATDAGRSGGYAALSVTPFNGLQFAWDADGDGYLDSDERDAETYAPLWLRIERDGATFTGSYSKDGEDWTALGSVELTDADPRQDAAVFTCSHTNSKGIAEFDEFTVG
ncbi:glycoside hydrolase family 97 catalytic domain-containing protein [Halomicroarcula sp. GCM10025324]|uniref:glycoside hydrolase family 97 catalytic domain-containing protein n=1 Tax=Haloarcula TaxID=2237 RepID=UPI0023E796BC|nr:glycoside hydrolase family 97 catalytic domain-containing protein [Halomicroarcula sp. ZS-22-S1]